MKTIYKKLIFIILIIFPIICIPQSNGIIEIIEDIGNDNALIRLETDSGMLISESIIRFGLDSNNYQFSSIYENNYTPLNSFGDDILESTVWMPGEQTGIHPRDVIYNATNNKYYLYGGRRVVIIDASTNTITNTITVSDVASISPSTSFTAIPIQKRLAYNTLHNKLYCSTENMELVVIDCTPGQEEEIIETISVNLCNVLSTSIVYNELYDRVYWVLNQINDYKYIKVYDGGVSNTFLFEESYWYSIFDIIINSTGNKVFISNGQKIRMLNANNLEEIAHYQIGGVGYAGNLVYNSVLDKLYCQIFENNIITVLDGNTCSFLSNINSTAYRGFRSCFNNIYNKVYFTCSDEQNQNKIIIIDSYNDIEICSYDIISPYPVIFDNNNKIYCGGYELTSIDGDDNSIICNCNLARGYSKGLAYSHIENKIISANLMGGTAPILNPDCQIEELTKVGGNIIFGCYNSTYNKVYFPQSSELNEENFLSIIDGETNQYIDQLDIGCNITSCAYNVENDYLYVGIDSWSEKAVKKIDGYTNEIINTFQLNTNPLRIYSGNGDNVYVGGVNRIIVINAESNQINEIELPWISIVTDFAEDIEENRIFTCLDNTNKVVGIDGSTLTILDMIDVGDNPFGIVYNDISEINKLYCINYSSGTVSIINVDNNNNYNIINTLPTLGAPISIAFSKRSNKIYVLGDLGITVIDGNNDENILSTIILENDMYAFSLIYNPVNNKIYVHKMFGNPNLEMLVYVLDCETDEVCSTISLEQYQQLGIFSYSTPAYEKMVYNTENNKIYSCNQYFSNVSVIQCAPDQLHLRSGWTWLSFPRLERTPNNPTPETVLAQDRISGTEYTYLEMKHKKIVNHEPVMTYVTWNIVDGWQNVDLEDVDSRFGYKLYLEPTENRTIDMLGTVLDPSTPIDIYQGPNNPENWEGYWLYESQWPFDAIPDNVLDELTVIKEQDWCCVKRWDYWEGNLVPYWICAVHEGDVSFDYGDMVILKTNSDLSFQWQRYGNPPSSEEKSATEYFQFNEQSNYTSFFIELDTNSNPQEIGAFIGDSCIGASTLLISDTIVLIPGYIEGMSGEVTFEEYYDSLKSGKPKIKEYLVNNIKTGTWEKRIINTGEKQDYYLISFKTGKITNETESNPVSISCAPNPLKNEVTIKFTVQQECMLQIGVYDLYGKSLNILQQGVSKAGTYNINWTGTDRNGKPLPNGVYILKLRAGTNYAHTKIVIVK